MANKNITRYEVLEYNTNNIKILSEKYHINYIKRENSLIDDKFYNQLTFIQ